MGARASDRAVLLRCEQLRVGYAGRVIDLLSSRILSRESLLGVAYLPAWATSLTVGDRIHREA